MILDEATEGDLPITGSTVALLPLGTTEGHGTYLPHGTDTFIAEALARRVADRYRDCLVLPALAYGMSEHYAGVGFPVSISPETEAAVIEDICDSLIGNGIRRILVLNGHDGNVASIEIAARRIRKRHGVTVAALEAWWWALSEIAADDPAISIPGGHAGMHETALTMAARPDLVRLERAASPEEPEDSTYFNPLLGVRVYAHYLDYHRPGQYADPTQATAEVGERLISRITDHVVEFLEHAARVQWRFGPGVAPGVID